MTNESWLRNFTHLLKLRGRHPNKVKETVERRKTQGISDLVWKRKLLHIHYEFQEISGIPKERTSRLLNTFSLNFVYYLGGMMQKCTCYYAG